MGVGAGLYIYDVVVSSRSLSHLLMSSCLVHCLRCLMHSIFTSYLHFFVSLYFIIILFLLVVAVVDSVTTRFTVAIGIFFVCFTNYENLLFTISIIFTLFYTVLFYSYFIFMAAL